ncbi:MAG: ATP-binding protein [Thermodesulfovibrionales bacterium]
MKTKLFLSFVAVVVIALVSNFIFRFLIERDFEEYVQSMHEDQLYWVMATVEGSYDEGRWQREMLADALHWGVMLGFDLIVEDARGDEVMKASDVMSGLGHAMHRRMESLIDYASASGPYEEYPLFMSGEEIGTLKVRGFQRRGQLAEKESTFKRRGREFLIISFIIAGGGAIFLSIVFSIFLSRPVLQLKKATEDIASGNFGVRVNSGSRDEIGKLARSFNFMSEALRREDEIRKRLTSNIAHELRTPLTVMKANLEGIEDGVITVTPERVRNLRDEVERLIRLVEGIEDMTRAEASFLKQGKLLPVNLREFLEKQAFSVKEVAEGKGIALRIEGEEDLRVISDPEKLATIVKNLISNAVRFTDAGEVRLRYGARGKSAFIEVSDTGRGMSEQEVSHIFERFYKGRDSEGTGLGLSIVQELLPAVRGEIDVRAVLGRGSTFTVRIPVEGEEA